MHQRSRIRLVELPPGPLLLVTALLIAALPLAGCVIDDDDPPRPLPLPPPTTCELYDEYLFYCTASCRITPGCESWYLDAFPADQILMDDCADCLIANLDAGVCADCAIPRAGITSCDFFLEDLLGIVCF